MNIFVINVIYVYDGFIILKNKAKNNHNFEKKIESIKLFYFRSKILAQ